MGFPSRHPITGKIQWSYDPAVLEDGYPHRRDMSGFCGTCGATSHEPHYRCIPQGQST